MGNYSSNFSAYKGIGWRSLFGSAIALYALSGVSYIFGCRLAQSILSLIAAMIILIINIVASMPEKSNSDTRLERFRRSISSMPLGYKYALDLVCIVSLGNTIGFDDWLLLTFVILLISVDVLYFYKISKRDQDDKPLA